MDTGRRFVLIVAAALALGACAQPAEPVVASANGGATPTASATGGIVAQYVAEVRKYVQCMRTEGFNLPDPGPKGELDYSSLSQGGQNPKKDPKFLAASVKCSPLLPPVPEELQDYGPPLTAEQIEYVRQYAKCMRANGVPDFPDPDANGHFTRGYSGGSTEQQAQATFRAGQICEPLIDGRPTSTPNPNATGQG